MMTRSFALGRFTVVSGLLGLAVLPVLVACSGSQASVGANTSADTAHLAQQANEPRTGDSTAAQPAGATPTNRPQVAIGGTTSAPEASGTSGTSGTAAASDGSGSTASAAARGGSHEEDPKRIGARHVLVQWMGSDRAGKSVLRTKEQALVLAQEVLKRARAGEDLGRLAVEYSDEPNAGARGGSLGRFTKGQMVGAFEAVAFKLKVGEISDIVETPFGYHIIQRTE